VVLIVRVALFVAAVRKAGEIVHVAPTGSPAQNKATFPLKPPFGISNIENVAVPPGFTIRLAGDPTSAKLWSEPEGSTVTMVEPHIVPAQALTVDDPGDAPKTTPLFVDSLVMAWSLPESFVTSTDAEFDELQTTEASTCVLLLLNVPMATSCWESPTKMDGSTGLTLIATKFVGVRVPGWYISALVNPELLSLQPPAIRTVPFERSVAVWTCRAFAKLPVALKDPATGS
jgi:hypothetical protein